MFRTAVAATIAAGLLALPALAEVSVEKLTMEAMEGMAMAERSGMFEGRSNHVSSGGVELQKTVSGGYVVVLGEDFMLDGGPDPHVALGRNGEYDAETELGMLKELNGKQFYAIPASIDAASVTEVFLWCNVADVPLAVATLN